MAEDTQESQESLRQRALAAYKPPFTRRYGFIYDADGNMVCDENCTESPAALLRVRGWGRLSYLPNAEALQDTVGDIIAEALTEYWERRKSS